MQSTKLNVRRPKTLDRPFLSCSPLLLAMVLLWLCCIIAAAVLADSVTANWVGANVPIQRLMRLFEIMKLPGNFIFTVAVAGLLVISHRERWRAAGFLCMCGIVSGAIGALLKWTVGRTRPFHGVPALELHPFRGGLKGLFDGRNLSFPSGHTCLAFATATGLTILIPRGRVAFFIGASIVAAERVLQGSHYVADVVAAAGIGIVSAFLTWSYVSAFWDSGARVRAVASTRARRELTQEARP